MHRLSVRGALFLPIGERRPPAVLGLLAAVLSVAAATALVYPLGTVAPVVSLSVVYLPAVLLLSTFWGLLQGLGTALLSAMAFNFFHIPPVGRFTIADSRNWVALAAFAVVAVVASAIAELARTRSLEAERRRAEADLAAALARELLAGTDTQRALASAAHAIATALGLRSAAIELGSAATDDSRRTAIALHAADGSQLGALIVPSGLPADTAHRLRTRVAPTLEALVEVAQRRDQLLAEAVQTESLRRSDEVKTALLRAVSHDLRTPLTAIVAAGHALGSDTIGDRDRHELASAVVTEGQRLASLVEKLLDLSRLQGGGANPRREWVSVEETVLAARDSIGVQTAEIRLALPADLPDVRADPAQLERVFANLLENAARYAGGAPVSVSALRSGGRVLVRVTDQGPGLSPAELDRIFEPFYRGRPEVGRPGSGRSGGSGPDAAQLAGGSGLGLAIARGFTEANGGTLTAESLPGQGTTFVVALPT